MGTKKTEVVEAGKERPLVLIGGGSALGKSFFCANIPDSLIYDTDLGGGLAPYDERIKRNGSERIEASSYKDILDDLKERQHGGRIKTNLVIDHLTILQQTAIIDYNPQYKDDFGRSYTRAHSDWRKIRDYCRVLDCGLFCTAHMKGTYEDGKEVGKEIDGAKNLEADFPIVLYLMGKGGAYPSTARVKKWRRDPEDARGLLPTTFPFTWEEFKKVFGMGIDRERTPVIVASVEQVSELKRLVDVVKLPEGQVEKWLTKASVETIDELPAELAAKCIEYVKKLIEKGGK
jgi:hypothetical protein